MATIDGIGSGVGIDSSEDAVWASNKSDGIFRIDPATNVATLVFAKPQWSYGLAYGDGDLWVSGTENNEVSRLPIPEG